MRIQFEIKESLINILDQLMHSDFWATEIKEDESGKKIIKIKDLAYNLEAVAEAHKLAVEVSAYVCTQNGAMPELPARLKNELI